MSVAGDGPVDETGPEIDAPAEALAASQTLLAQPRDDLKTPCAVVAIDHQRAFGGLLLQGLKALGNRAHRDQFGAFQPADLVFVGLADVNETGAAPILEGGLELPGLDFKGQVIHTVPIYQAFRHAVWIGRA